MKRPFGASWRFFLVVVQVMCVLNFSLELCATTVRLSWTASTDSDIAGYKVYYGTVSRHYDTSIYVDNITAYTLDNLKPANYYFAVTAIDTSGNESQFSNEAVLTLLPGATFTGITLSGLTEDSVTINWMTNTPTSGIVRYGVVGLENSRSDSSLATGHETQLTGLAPSTVYHYQVTVTTGNNTKVDSDVLRFKTSDLLGQPAKPSSQAIFLPSVVEGPRFRTNLGINNLATSIANVSATLVDQQGIVLGSQTVQVAPRGLQQLDRVARLLSQNNSENGLQGSLYLESDQPIYAWASQIDNISNDPSLWEGKGQGATRVLIPSVANTSDFSSSLALMNAGASAASVVLKVYTAAGGLGNTAAFSIPTNGLLDLDNVLGGLGVQDSYGPLEIISVNNMPLIAGSRVSSSSGVGGFFEGVDATLASVVETIPVAVDSLQLRTNLGINNAGAQVANVTIRLMDRDGIEVGTAPIMVAANGLTQINHVVRMLLGQTEVTNFEGYLRLESDQPIFAWAAVIDNQTNDPGFAQSKSSGATDLLIESATNQGNFRSSLIVVNLGPVAAAIDIRAYDVAGQIRGEEGGLLVPARGYFSDVDILSRLGISNGFGPVEIICTNGQPVLVISRVSSTSGNSGFFEGLKSR